MVNPLQVRDTLHPTWPEILCAKRVWNREPVVVAVHVCVNAGNADTIQYCMVNLKWRGLELYMSGSYIRNVDSCYQVTSEEPDCFTQYMAVTASQWIEIQCWKCICVSVSVLAVQHRGGLCLWNAICDNPHDSLASTDTLQNQPISPWDFED